MFALQLYFKLGQAGAFRSKICTETLVDGMQLIGINFVGTDKCLIFFKISIDDRAERSHIIHHKPAFQNRAPQVQVKQAENE